MKKTMSDSSLTPGSMSLFSLQCLHKSTGYLALLRFILLLSRTLIPNSILLIALTLGMKNKG
jgi:hypothetical protein